MTSQQVGEVIGCVMLEKGAFVVLEGRWPCKLVEVTCKWEKLLQLQMGAWLEGREKRRKWGRCKWSLMGEKRNGNWGREK